MKQILSFIIGLISTVTVVAQCPNQLTYQAIVRDNDNILLTDVPVGLQIDVLHNSEDGTIIYTETHESLTNSNGLVSIQIGKGEVIEGKFSSINWGDGTYFIKTSIDPEGGSDYTIIGISQCMSVPYALFTNTADTINGSISKSQIYDLVTEVDNTGAMNAKNYGVTGDGVTDDTQAILELLDSANGRLVFFPEGTYICTDSIQSSNVNIEGVKPYYNEEDGSLVNGTIFNHKLRFTGSNIKIQNIGIDLHGQTPDDGLVAAPAWNTGRCCNIKNIVSVGADKTSPFEAVRIHGFKLVDISDIEVRDAYTGIVLKNQGGTISNIRAFNIDQECVYIISDNVDSYCMDLVVDKIYVENTSSPHSIGLLIKSEGAQIENISVSNVFIKRTQIGLAIISAGHNGIMANNVSVNNLKVDYPSLDAIYFEANNGSVENINLSNVDITHATNILTTVGTVRYINLNNLNANVIATATTEQKQEIINIGSATVGTNLSNIIVLTEHSKDTDLTISYNNAADENRISNYNISLSGGVPQSE